MKDPTRLSNQKELLALSDKEKYMRVYALEKVLSHLKANLNDPRKRERLRVSTALGHITNWMTIGGQVYDEERTV